MAAKNRADLIANLFKVVKKEFRPILPPSNRTVIEHAIYGCCLEDSTFEAADEAFAKLHENYFDWNEVRVTTAKELAETMKSLGHPMMAAERMKKLLYGIFETFYQFDLEFLKKENLSKAIIQFEKMNGVSPFTISYMAQNGLGGHSIPTDRSLLELMVVIGAISEEEAGKGRVPGLERAIAKAKGGEFSSLVHQLAVAFHSSPFSTTARNIILKVTPEAKERFPKRGAKSKPAAAAPAKKAPAKKAADAKPVAKTQTKTPAKKAAVKKTAAKKTPLKKTPVKKTPVKKAPVKKAAAKKASAKKATKKKTASKSLAKKKPR
jgi:endonuclease-3